MILAPLEQPGNLNLKDNTATNSYIIVRWIFFTIMLLSIIAILIPFLSLWKVMLIPQRVDSRAQRDYYEKYEKLLAEEKEKLQREKEFKERNQKIQAELDNNPVNNDVLLPISNNINAGQGIEMATVNNNNEIAEQNIKLNNNQPENENPETRKKRTVNLARFRNKDKNIQSQSDQNQ
jgi:hypothetical protein